MSARDFSDNILKLRPFIKDPNIYEVRNVIEKLIKMYQEAIDLNGKYAERIQKEKRIRENLIKIHKDLKYNIEAFEDQLEELERIRYYF